MKHYVCQGDCGGESKRPGVCSADGCSHFQTDLVLCDCNDGSHEEVLFGRHEEVAALDEVRDIEE